MIYGRCVILRKGLHSRSALAMQETMPSAHTPVRTGRTAPPVYRPPAALAMQRNVPSAHIPARTPGAAPPVYRPPAALAMQRNVPSAYVPARTPGAAPPVYRPQAVLAAQRNVPSAYIPARTPGAAPPVYRPQPVSAMQRNMPGAHISMPAWGAAPPPCRPRPEAECTQRGAIAPTAERSPKAKLAMSPSNLPLPRLGMSRILQFMEDSKKRKAEELQDNPTATPVPRPLLPPPAPTLSTSKSPGLIPRFVSRPPKEGEKKKSTVDKPQRAILESSSTAPSTGNQAFKEKLLKGIEEESKQNSLKETTEKQGNSEQKEGKELQSVGIIKNDSALFSGDKARTELFKYAQDIVGKLRGGTLEKRDIENQDNKSYETAIPLSEIQDIAHDFLGTQNRPGSNQVTRSIGTYSGKDDIGGEVMLRYRPPADKSYADNIVNLEILIKIESKWKTLFNFHLTKAN
jgi:hypothetical protein